MVVVINTERLWNALASLHYNRALTGSRCQVRIFVNLMSWAVQALSALFPRVDRDGAFVMAGSARGIVFGSIGVAGLLAVASVLDIVLGIPFQKQMLLDIMLLLSAALVIYMGIDCLQDMK